MRLIKRLTASVLKLAALAMRQQVLDSNGAVICSDLRSLIVQIHSALDVYRRTGDGTIGLTLRVVARRLSGGLCLRLFELPLLVRGATCDC
jgi:hypothetical protein